MCFFFLGWGRVFLWSCMLLDFHVLSFVFVCLSALVGWDFSLNHQQLNSYDQFLMPKPTMGTPSLTFTNIHENSQLNSYVFFETGQNVPNKVQPKRFPSLKLTVRKFRTWRVGDDDLIVIFWGVVNGLWTQGSCEKLQGGYISNFSNFRAGGQTWPRSIAVGEFAD